MNGKIVIANANGNTFIIIENNNEKINQNQIQKYCRKYKTDGFIILDLKNIKMDYYNNDGSWETMCANCARCAALFMWKQKKCEENIIFLTGDGTHKIQIKNQDLISLSMIKPLFKTNEIIPNGYKGKFIDSGAKHFVCHQKQINEKQALTFGKKIRHSTAFFPKGVNVNFFTIIQFKVYFSSKISKFFNILITQRREIF